MTVQKITENPSMRTLTREPRGGLLILALLILSCASSTRQQKEQEMNVSSVYCPTQAGSPGKLIVFGDSQAAGSVSFKDGCPYSYANVIAEHYGMRLENRANPGSQLTEPGHGTEAQSQTVLKTEITAHDTVLFMVGFNDVLEHGDDSAHLTTFEVTLRYIMPKLARAGKVWLVTPFTLDDYSQYSGSLSAAYKYTLKIESVIGATHYANIIPIDITPAFIPMAELFFPDKVHLTVEAQNEMAKIIISEIESIK